MTSPFTVTLVRSDTANTPSKNHLAKGEKREIWLRSTLPFVTGPVDRIALEKVHDDDPSGTEPLDSDLSFIIALGKHEGKREGKSEEDGDITPPIGAASSDHVRLDKETEKPFMWKATGAKAVADSAYFVSFADGSEIVSSLLHGDFIYIGITFEPHGVQPFPDLFGLQRAAPFLLSGQSSGGPGGGDSRPRWKENWQETPIKDGDWRLVQLGRRPLEFGWDPTGFVGWLFAYWQETWQHWVVIVGNMYHELQYDADNINFYQNGRVGNQFWREDVSWTRFNDRAIADAGRAAIDRMESHYSPHTGVNCQKFCIELFNVICPGRTKKFAIYGVRGVEMSLNFNFQPQLSGQQASQQSVVYTGQQDGSFEEVELTEKEVRDRLLLLMSRV